LNLEPARPLNADEETVLRLFLQPDFDGVEYLRAKIHWSSCGRALRLRLPDDQH